LAGGSSGKREELLRVTQQYGPGVGEPDTARQPIEQHQSEPVFQLPDFPRNRWLAHVQTIGSCADTSGSRHLQKGQQVRKVHRFLIPV
jgi:hypothetical protein